MKYEGPLHESEHRAISVIFGKLVRHDGNLESSAFHIGKRKSQIHRYQDPKDAALPTVADVAIMEQVTGRPLITEYLAHRANCILILPIETDGPFVDVLQGVGKLGMEFGETVASVTETIADGVIKPAEAARVIKEARDLLAATAGMIELMKPYLETEQ